MTDPKYVDRGIIEPQELADMLDQADEIENEYFRLRVKALISIAKKFGKRRSEIAALKREDLKIWRDQLFVTFTLRKKHKKGLFQYLRYLDKNNPKALEKPLSELRLEWKEWTQTEHGYRIKEERRTKSV